MRKIILFLILILPFLSIGNASGQSNFGRPVTYYSKNQSKNLKKFCRGKRHKKYISFNNRSSVNHPSVVKNSKRILRRRYRENKITFSKN